MVYADYHVHTTFSNDGISTIKEQIEQAIKLGLKEICITDHFDIYDNVLQYREKDLDVDNYIKTLVEYKEQYKYKLKVLVGIEIGLQPDIVKIVKDLTNRYNFDFIIGSSHITDKKNISVDMTFFKGLTQKQATQKYFNEMLQNVKLHDNFSVYGHIDYICRYGGYDNKFLEYKDYLDILDEILITIIEKGKGIEINTSGYRYGLNTPHPNEQILKRYKDLGGEIITIGSDAHKAEHLCSNFDKAVNLIKYLGYDKYAVFEDMQPRFIKI